MPFLQVCLCLLRSWFVQPGWDVEPWNVWIGPHSPEYSFCYIDKILDKAYTNDLPKCLYVLQDMRLLELAPKFYDAGVNPVIQLVHLILEEEAIPKEK